MAKFHSCSPRFQLLITKAKPVSVDGQQRIVAAQPHRYAEFVPSDDPDSPGGCYETFDAEEIAALRRCTKYVQEIGPRYGTNAETLVVADADTVGSVLDHMGAAPVPADPDLDSDRFALPDVLPDFEE